MSEYPASPTAFIVVPYDANYGIIIRQPVSFETSFWAKLQIRQTSLHYRFLIHFLPDGVSV